MPHISDVELFILLPFGAAIAFLVWFLWNMTKQLRR